MNFATDEARRQAIRALLCCPVCHGTLADAPERLVCTTEGCGLSYPVVRGKPIMLAKEAHTLADYAPPDGADMAISAHPYGPRSVEVIDRHKDGWVLDLGSGGKGLCIPHVVQMDIFPYPRVDVVASAHALPFKPGVFDAVVSQAVFEHLRWPERAVDEIRRVAKLGAEIKIDTAFLQPEHAYPDHYFNATLGGLKHWFRAFEITWEGVEDYQRPVQTLSWILSVYLAALPEEKTAWVRTLSVGALVDALQTPERPEHAPLFEVLTALSADKERELACGVSIIAHNRPPPEVNLPEPNTRPPVTDRPFPGKGIYRRLKRRFCDCPPPALDPEQALRKSDSRMIAQLLSSIRLESENARLATDLKTLKELLYLERVRNTALTRQYLLLQDLERQTMAGDQKAGVLWSVRVLLARMARRFGKKRKASS